MQNEIPFNDIMKKHKNWDDDCNYDIMSANYNKLKPILPLFYFSKKPDHPQVFSLLFSQESFAQDFIDYAMMSNVRNVKRVWFTEYSIEDRYKLIERGMYELIFNDIGDITYYFMRNDTGDEIFVNVIL